MKRMISIALAVLLAVALWACGAEEANVDAETTEATTLESTVSTEEVSTVGETESISETTTTTTAATTTAKPTIPTASLKQSPKTFTKDTLWGVISAGNYYEQVAIGKTFQYTGSGINWAWNVQKNTQYSTDDGGQIFYHLFITQDGKQQINFNIDFEANGIVGGFTKTCVLQPTISGNDVKFSPGKAELHEKQKFSVTVSGFFMLEYAAMTEWEEAADIYDNGTLIGLVLSQAEVNEFFATGKIARYGNYDFSGLNELSA